MPDPSGPRLPAPRPTPVAARRRLGRTAIAALLLVSLGTALAACSTSPYPRRAGPDAGAAPGAATGTAPYEPSLAQPEGPPKVAFLVPLSGPQAELGQAMLNAAEIAVQDVAGDDFELLPRDTGSTPDGARAAAEDAIAEGARMIIGPLLRDSVAAVGPVAQAHNVNVVSFSSDETVAGDGVFVMGFLPRAQVERVVQHVASLGVLRFAVLAPDTDYGRLVAQATLEAVVRNGGELTKTAFYDPTAPDVSGTVREFANYDLRSEEQRENGEGLDYEAVMLPEGGVKLLQVAPQLPFFDVDPEKVRFLGTGQWDSSVVFRETNLLGGMFAAPPPAARARFVQSYTEAFGEPPPRLATLGYDATALAAVLSREPGGPDFSRAALTANNGFSGTDGIFRFLPDGTVQRSLAVLQIGRGRFTVVSPPAESFELVFSN